MPYQDGSMGEKFSQAFRDRMYEFYVYTEYAKGAVVSQPLTYNRKAGMERIQKALLKEMRAAEKEAMDFAGPGVIKAYRTGWSAGHNGQDKKYTQAALRDLLGENGIVTNAEKDVSKAFLKTRAELQRITSEWRFSLRDIASGAKTPEQAAKALGKYQKLIMDDKISPLEFQGKGKDIYRYETVTKTDPKNKSRTYKERVKIFVRHEPTVVRWRFDTYMNMIGRYHSQLAYTKGNMQAMHSRGVKYVRVSDGPDCGWTFHDDTLPADGLTMRLEDARQYPLSHANCVRSFEEFTPPPGEEVPAMDRVQNPKNQRVARSKVGQAFKDYQEITKRALLVNAREMTINTGRETAQLLIGDLTTDANFRRKMFTDLIDRQPGLRGFDDRTERVLLDLINKRSREGIGPKPDKLDIYSNTSRWIDKWMENPDTPMPPYVRHIVRIPDPPKGGWGGATAVKEKEQVLEYMLEHDMTKELYERAQMTHQQLNVVNSIEKEYGEKFFAQFQAHFFGKDGERGAVENAVRKAAAGGGGKKPPIFKIYGGTPNFGDDDEAKKAFEDFVRRYSFDSKVSDKIKGQTMTEIRAQGYNRIFKGPVDTFLDAIIPDSLKSTKFTAVKTHAVGVEPGTKLTDAIRQKLDLKHMGLRYDWNTRYLKVQSTTVNKFNFLTDKELRAVAYQKGIPVKEYITDAKKMKQVLKYKSRKSVLDEVGYNLGALTRITLKPHELVRIGFRWDPATGWRKPLPRLSVSTPKFRGVNARLVLTLNKGFSLTNINMLAHPAVRRGLDQRGNILVDGLRLRTVTQELTIGLGGLLDVNKYLKYGKFVFPGLQNVGIRSATLVGRMDSMSDARRYMRLVGISGFYDDMAVINFFAEMKFLGWSWMRIAHTFRIAPGEMHLFAEAFAKTYHTARAEIGLATIWATALIQANIPGADPDNIAEYVSKYSGWLSKDAGKNLTAQQKVDAIKAYKKWLVDTGVTQ